MYRTMKQNGSMNDMPVRVQMRSGHTRYGLLLDEPANDENSAWRFIPSEHITSYIETQDNGLVEYLPGVSVVSIDQYLK